MESAKHILRVELTPDEDRDLGAMAERLSITKEEVLRRLLQRTVAHTVVGWDEDAAMTLTANEFDHLLDALATEPTPNEAMRRLMSNPSVLER